MPIFYVFPTRSRCCLKIGYPKFKDGKALSCYTFSQKRRFKKIVFPINQKVTQSRDSSFREPNAIVSRTHRYTYRFLSCRYLNRILLKKMIGTEKYPCS